MYLKRELLEGLGIDPDTLEVRIRIQGPGEQERPPGGEGVTKAAAREAGGWKQRGKLLEAFSLLCQAGERFVSYMGEGRQQATRPTSSVEASGEVTPEGQGRPEAGLEEREPGRKGAEEVGLGTVVHGGAEEGAVLGDEVCQKVTEGGG
jgi:hypothetical protein